MKRKIPLIARVALGLVFLLAGIAGLFNLAPPPKNLPPDMDAFMKGIMATGYFFPLLKGTETLCGALLVLGLFVPLALVVLAPIILNIVLVHLFMAPEGLPLALFLGALEIYLAFFAQPYSNTVKQLFRR